MLAGEALGNYIRTGRHSYVPPNSTTGAPRDGE
jgi:hypothetical protein